MVQYNYVLLYRIVTEFSLARIWRKVRTLTLRHFMMQSKQVAGNTCLNAPRWKFQKTNYKYQNKFWSFEFWSLDIV